MQSPAPLVLLGSLALALLELFPQFAELLGVFEDVGDPLLLFLAGSRRGSGFSDFAALTRPSSMRLRNWSTVRRTRGFRLHACVIRW